MQRKAQATVPRSAPSDARTSASRRNWKRTSTSEAPIAFLSPISKRRSEYEISMTERTPTPPTRRTVAASEERITRQPRISWPNCA